jgi:uncharacterized protein (DUF1778 family)
MKRIPKRGRPRKPKNERKDVDLRIPVTGDQKELIARAASLAGGDMAAWARPILLGAAQKTLSELQRVAEAG